MRRRAVGRSLLLMALAVPLGGCAYLGMVKEKRHLRSELEEEPKVSLVRQLAPESCLILIGKIEGTAGRKEQLRVVALSDRFVQNEVVATRMVPKQADSFYGLFLPPADYDVLILADRDGDGTFSPGEVVGRTPPGKKVSLVAGAARGIFVEGPAITVDFANPTSAPFTTSFPATPHDFVRPSLADPLFDPKLAETGLYDPAAFLAKTQGVLYGLQRYEPGRTVVLFVHGIEGSPRDFAFLEKGLDRRRYLPFFFYYPSGLPLDVTGLVLAAILAEADRSSELGVDSLVLVAHSMGGLVARRAINEVCASGCPPELKGYVSFASPYGGNDAAKSGAKAPEAVAAWKDVATGSAFITRLLANPFPAGLPFHLFFAWGKEGSTGPGPAGDGTIALRSQLDPRVQPAARRLYGYEESHVGVLQNEAARRDFLAVLDALTRPPKGT